MQNLKVLNDNIVITLAKYKQKVDKTQMFGTPQISSNYGTVIHAGEEHSSLIGKLVYFKNQYDRLHMNGAEVFVMKYENLLAECNEEIE